MASDDSPLGLHYAIRPVRDSQGQPLRDVGEMRSRWVIEVIGPAHENILSDKKLKKYEVTPIRDGEYYYCEFYNGSWHMSDGGIGKAYAFYLSGRVGQAEWLQNANDFVERHHKPDVGHTHLFDVFLNLQGKQYPRDDGLNKYSVAMDKEGRLFLRINNSPPKQMYMINPANERDDSSWCFLIEKLRGHGDREVLSNIRESLQKELQQQGITIPRVRGIRQRGRVHE
ncbi:hypothetical protein [Archangium violaceum]|uniref:hypothetical protein n=1 Tax=Archangium violaceum TaxID=83451 RepID=UPI0036DC706D